MRNVIRLGHDLGLQLVAEGVETEKQWQLLENEGCDIVQGFLFGEARPAASLDQLIASGGPAPTHR